MPSTPSVAVYKIWALVDTAVDGALGVLHTSGIKTVNVR